MPSPSPRVVEDPDVPGVLAGLPDLVPRVLEPRRVELDEVVAQADAGRVDGVRHAVARADVVERVVQLGPGVLREVRDQLEVQRLDQVTAHQARELVRRAEDDVELQAAGGELGERLVERVERGHADADALLLAELLQHRRVEVVRVVVDAQLAAPLGLHGGLDRLADAGQRDAVVAAGQRDARGIDGAARRRIPEDALAAAGRGAGHGDGRRRVLAARERGAAEREPARAGEQRAPRQTILPT
jgi:hypothetical protein